MRMELRDKLLMAIIKWSPFATSTLHAPYGHHYHVLEVKPNQDKELPEGQGDTQKIKLLPGTSAKFTVSGSVTVYEGREYRAQVFPHHTPGLVVMGGDLKVMLGPDSGETDDPILGHLKFNVPENNNGGK